MSVHQNDKLPDPPGSSFALVVVGVVATISTFWSIAIIVSMVEGETAGGYIFDSVMLFIGLVGA